MNIITGKAQSDEGSISWANKIHIGYLDQHTSITPGHTIEQTLKTAFKNLYALEDEMNNLYMQLENCNPHKLNKLPERASTIQDFLMHNDF